MAGFEIVIDIIFLFVCTNKMISIIFKKLFWRVFARIGLLVFIVFKKRLIGLIDGQMVDSTTPAPD